ncbi:uncharacterized protein PFL1_01775 [Pseudozyma flocculosa PF-1]|uniref:uncharacterized protein n=1 Tax=Pseudozyma flocculosa PF-1 TaxID=1277687 RepID=UPI00045602EE|nr:uncharacterized protein PFL1_01775 [Pseudozyma flocculosa PF-1]EPQ30878.1 hypothetical protein PFL1_01775 [Pseudozyma flocculosa PF-1]
MELAGQLERWDLYAAYRTKDLPDGGRQTIIEVCLPRWLDHRLRLDAAEFLIDVFRFRPSGLDGQMTAFSQQVVDIVITPVFVPYLSFSSVDPGVVLEAFESRELCAALLHHVDHHDILSTSLGSLKYQLYLAEPARQHIAELAGRNAGKWRRKLDLLKTHAAWFQDEILPELLEVRGMKRKARRGQ